MPIRSLAHFILLSAPLLSQLTFAQTKFYALTTVQSPVAGTRVSAQPIEITVPLRSLDTPTRKLPLTPNAIIYTCDPTVDAAVPGLCNRLNTEMAGLYASTFTNATATIYIRFAATSLGASTTSYSEMTYANFRIALLATATSANDNTAYVASVPAANPFPTRRVAVTNANLRVLGGSPTGGLDSAGAGCNVATDANCFDSIITISSAQLAGGNLWFRTGPPITASQYDYFSVVQHETDEVLGTSSQAFGFVFGGNDHISPPDMFRYHSDGTRSLSAGNNNACTTSDNNNACFSINGTTMVHQYHNTNDGNDAGDWQTNCVAVQDNAGCLGGANRNIGPDEILVLDVVGYRLAAVLTPDLSITKTHLNFFSQGQIGATYTLTVFNGGPGSTTGAAVTVTDTLPAGLTATAMSGSGWSCNVGTITCTSSASVAALTNFPPITLTVNVSATAALNLINSATVSGGGEAALNNGNNSANDPTFVLQLPDLTITKSHAGAFTQGQTGATYTLTVRNLGPGSTTGASVIVTDSLPASLTATAMSGAGWSCNVGTVTCISTSIVLPAGVFSAITLTVNVDPNAPAAITNSVTVAGGGELAVNAGNNNASDPTIVILLPDLTVAKSHLGDFTQGQLGAVYTITVSNTILPGNNVGPTTGAVVTLTDTLPLGLTAVGMSGAGWTCVVATATCTSTQVVAPGASFAPITLTVNVATNSPLNVVNNVAVTGGGELPARGGNNTAADPTKILPLDYLIRYAANLTNGDAVINISNTGFNGASLTGPGFGVAVGNICMNVYAFSPDEQLISCCSCLITPNGLVSLSVANDLISNTLTGVRPNSVVVKLVNTGAGAAFSGTSCTNSAAQAGTASFPTAGGSIAFGSTVHASGTGFAVTETPFIRATLSPTELASITNRCTNILGNGSGFGICRSCRTGGLSLSR